MRAPAPRAQLLTLGVAVLSAAALCTATASAASAAGAPTSAKLRTTTATATSVVHEQGGQTTGEAGHGGGTTGGAGHAGAGQAGPATGFGVAYHPTADAPGDVNAANKRFAACMRRAGQKTVPDIHASKDAKGRVQLQVRITDKGGTFDPTSKRYRKALKACGPVMAKAGVTFPAGAELPPLPDLPGKPGKPGKPTKVTSRVIEESGGPTLVTSGVDERA
ncbi:hypothetical protein [Streptomyces adustus]